MDGFVQYKKNRNKLEKALKDRMASIFKRPSIMPEIRQYRKIKGTNISLGELTDEDYEETENALDERMKHLSDTFQEYLFYIIKQKKSDKCGSIQQRPYHEADIFQNKVK